MTRLLSFFLAAAGGCASSRPWMRRVQRRLKSLIGFLVGLLLPTFLIAPFVDLPGGRRPRARPQARLALQAWCTLMCWLAPPVGFPGGARRSFTWRRGHRRALFRPLCSTRHSSSNRCKRAGITRVALQASQHLALPSSQALWPKRSYGPLQSEHVPVFISVPRQCQIVAPWSSPSRLEAQLM